MVRKQNLSRRSLVRLDGRQLFSAIRGDLRGDHSAGAVAALGLAFWTTILSQTVPGSSVLECPAPGVIILSKPQGPHWFYERKDMTNWEFLKRALHVSVVCAILGLLVPTLAAAQPAPNLAPY